MIYGVDAESSDNDSVKKDVANLDKFSRCFDNYGYWGDVCGQKGMSCSTSHGSVVQLHGNFLRWHDAFPPSFPEISAVFNKYTHVFLLPSMT